MGSPGWFDNKVDPLPDGASAKSESLEEASDAESGPMAKNPTEHEQGSQWTRSVHACWSRLTKTDTAPQDDVVRKEELTVSLVEVLRAAKTVIALRSTTILMLHLIFLFLTAYHMRPDEAVMKTAVSTSAALHPRPLSLCRLET
jgi:hypothetical protein